MAKARLDILLTERGLAESRAKAQALIMAGQVRIDGQTMLKASAMVPAEANVTVDAGPRFVSRGGEKLEAALSAFPIPVTDLICADVGASTGGFTDCLLQHGAARVYAIDVGKGILHWKIRNDSRVAVMENVNARLVERLPEEVDLATIDASFISLKILLPVVKSWLKPADSAGVVALIKPQFEAGKKDVARGEGVIRDPAVHRQVLLDVLADARSNGWNIKGLIRSPLLGPKGNAEFLVWLTLSGSSLEAPALVEEVLAD
jgi:23S rRNA (cytidine1920-2'-O)/16S rRNA (cytidine1409-2'-O)-methyltransferase